MSTRTILILSFLLVALLVGVLGAFGYSNLKHTANQVDVITDRETPILVRLSEMKSNILDDVEGGFANLTDAPPDKVESFEIPDPSNTSVAKIGEIADTGQGGQEEQTELLENMVSARRTMIIAARALIENYERDGTVYLSDVSEFGAGIDNMIPLIARFLAIENEEVAAAQQEIQATISGARRLTITLASVTIVLAIGLGLVLSRSILSPINRLREVTEDLGNGNLGVRAHIDPYFPVRITV